MAPGLAGTCVLDFDRSIEIAAPVCLSNDLRGFASPLAAADVWRRQRTLGHPMFWLAGFVRLSRSVLAAVCVVLACGRASLEGSGHNFSALGLGWVRTVPWLHGHWIFDGPARTHPSHLAFVDSNL